MAGSAAFRFFARLALSTTLAVGLVGAGASSPDTTASALSRWTGGVDLYRAGVFTTQQTWLWCTAADVQIIRNIVDHAADHSAASQRRYFDYMRVHNRYDIPVSDGVDAAGWAAGLRHYVDGRYRMIASRSFDSALHAAVTNLRRTNLPVGIAVMHGNHVWVLTGFTATADPATTTSFTVTSVRVVGPLWGLQSRTYGYDMRPDTKLTPSQLATFFRPWEYVGVHMAWEGRWVSVQPVAATTAPPKPEPTVSATIGPKPSPAVAASSSPAATPEAAPTLTPGPGDVAVVGPPVSRPPGDPDPSAATASTPTPGSSGGGGLAGLGVLAAAVVAALGALVLRSRRSA